MSKSVHEQQAEDSNNALIQALKTESPQDLIKKFIEYTKTNGMFSDDSPGCYLQMFYSEEQKLVKNTCKQVGIVVDPNAKIPTETVYVHTDYPEMALVLGGEGFGVDILNVKHTKLEDQNWMRHGHKMVFKPGIVID